MGCQGSKITEEAYAPTHDDDAKKTVKPVESMVLEDWKQIVRSMVLEDIRDENYDIIEDLRDKNCDSDKDDTNKRGDSDKGKSDTKKSRGERNNEDGIGVDCKVNRSASQKGETGIECKAVESDRERVLMRQQKAFKEHIRRETSALKRRRKMDLQKHKSWNTIPVA
eukprot:CAMPEP_0201151260 /NCGR_PEP_ID=MMETSP0851-20130426/12219_1 /ASSEMBLY_ACC=CAM_ASM_000631 /TAXON_ID=183588 /ORGANISM="Pseudo-nitzschia fraudulenta, Strain WWA7" /LENGTH=166 /DNA_ID=CAMNT_0047428075 /DNA_START=118 /DNA_END=618 /DNA_ORIENTATION=+